MKNQDKVIVIRIDNDLKKAFKSKCDKEYLKMSGRIKFLILKDSDNKVNFID